MENVRHKVRTQEFPSGSFRRRLAFHEELEGQQLNRWKTNVVLVPPNPKPFDITQFSSTLS